jgi:hypothetical protein
MNLNQMKKLGLMAALLEGAFLAGCGAAETPSPEQEASLGETEQDASWYYACNPNPPPPLVPEQFHACAGKAEGAYCWVGAVPGTCYTAPQPYGAYTRACFLVPPPEAVDACKTTPVNGPCAFYFNGGWRYGACQWMPR